MLNWYEILPGFWLPFSAGYDPDRWPDFTTDQYTRALEELPDPGALLKFLDYGQPTRKAWGSWLGAFNADKPLRYLADFHGPIADRMYETARYKYLVPAWRRAIVGVVQELDDIEDQISTILWIMEWITKKVIPIPPTVMNNAQRLQRSLDCAEKIVAGVTPFRFTKSEHTDCLRRTGEAKRGAKARKAGLIAWLRENWGRILEAAQATDTWFDVGIVLGPIMGYVEEGMWGLATQTLNNYLIAVDSLLPGYKEDFERNAAELQAQVDAAWDSTWGSLATWNTETVNEVFELPAFQN